MSRLIRRLTQDRHEEDMEAMTYDMTHNMTDQSQDNRKHTHTECPMLP